MMSPNLTAEGYIFAIRKITDRRVTPVGFCVNDSKGREVGCEVEFWTETVSEDPNQDQDSGSIAKREDLGTWFCCAVQKTANGKRFGAAQRGKCFRTQEEASAYAQERIADSNKKAAK